MPFKCHTWVLDYSSSQYLALPPYTETSEKQFSYLCDWLILAFQFRFDISYKAPS